MNRLSCYLVKPKQSRYWQLRYRRPGEERERSKSLGVRDKAAAERKKSDFIQDFEREEAGILPSRSLRETANASLGQLFDAFLLDLQNQRRDSMYVENLGRYLRIPADECGWKRVRDVTSATFKQWRSGPAGTKSATTLNHYLTSWKTFFNWLVSTERIELNPLRTVAKLKKGERVIERRAISDDDIATLLSVAPQARRLVYLVALHTGLRRNEMKLLEWRDVHLDGMPPTLKLRAATEKNRNGTTIFLHSELVAALTAARPATAAPTDRVLKVFKGLDPLKADLAKAGIPFTDEHGRRFDLHATRMTFNTRLASANVPIRIAMKAMRHSEERLTNVVYTDPAFLSVASSLGSLSFLEAEKVSGGLSGEHSDESDTTRNTTTQIATVTVGETSLEPFEGKRVGHAVTRRDTKKLLPQPPPEGALVGSGARARTSDESVADQGLEGPLSDQLSGDLSEVIKSWPELPPGHRAAILALVRSV